MMYYLTDAGIAHRVARRYLWAKRNLTKTLEAAVIALEAGDPNPALLAIRDFWSFLTISESSTGDWGTITTIKAEWYYALGPRDRSRVKDIIADAKELQRWLPNKKKEDVARYSERFQKLIADVKWLDKKVHQPEAEFARGDFTIVPMPGVSRNKITACLEALDQAADKIRRKFPQLLYGKVYLSKTLGGHNGRAVASFVDDNDTIQLSLKAAGTVGDVYALCHEFGHRFWYRFWKDSPAREKFWSLSTERVYEMASFDAVTRAKLADEFVEIASAVAQQKPRPSASDLLTSYLTYRTQMDLHRQREVAQAYVKEPSERNRDALHRVLARPGEPVLEYRTDKVLREPLAVTPYGGTSTSENFAEAFAHLVLNMAMPAEIAAIMNSL